MIATAIGMTMGAGLDPDMSARPSRWQRGEPGAWSPAVMASVQLRYRPAGVRGLQPASQPPRCRGLRRRHAGGAPRSPAGAGAKLRVAYVETWTIALWGIAAAPCRPFALGP